MGIPKPNTSLTYEEKLEKRKEQLKAMKERAVKKWQENQKKKPIVKKKRTKKTSIKSVEKRLKNVLYPLIKKSEINTCMSCQKINLEKENMNAGHFAKAELCNMVWRYFPLNIHNQCVGCNLGARGNTLEYRKQMILRYGLEIVEYIETHYNDPLPMNFNERGFLERLIEWYKKEPIVRTYSTIHEIEEDLKIFTNLGIYSFIP